MFVCLSCCKENECIFQMLLELLLNSKNTFVFKESLQEIEKTREEYYTYYPNAVSL